MKFSQRFCENAEENAFGEIGMFVVGIDRFRNINEGYGRQTGDKVLKTVAKLILELEGGGDSCLQAGRGSFGILEISNEEIVKNCMMQYARAASVTGEWKKTFDDSVGRLCRISERCRFLC